MFRKSKLIWLFIPALFIGSYAHAAKEYNKKNGGEFFDLRNKIGKTIKIKHLKGDRNNGGASWDNYDFNSSKSSKRVWEGHGGQRWHIGGEKQKKRTFRMIFKSGGREYNKQIDFVEDVGKTRKFGNGRFQFNLKFTAGGWFLTVEPQSVGGGSGSTSGRDTGGGSEPTDPCDPDHPDYDYWSCL